MFSDCKMSPIGVTARKYGRGELAFLDLKILREQARRTAHPLLYDRSVFLGGGGKHQQNICASLAIFHDEDDVVGGGGPSF